MDSDDDFQPLPSSPIVERKLKRLKKASRVSENPPPSSPPIKFPQFENNSALEDSIAGSATEIESLVDKNVTETVEEDDLGAKRVLEFDSVDYELDEKVTEKTTEEFGDKNSEELEIKQPSVDDDVVLEKKENKKKKNKRIDDGDGSEKKLKESNKRKAEKERRENLKKLRAESQRLLRETRDAAFKPVPLVQKPISSILDKIRKRKLEFLKKSNVSFDDNDDDDIPVDIDSEPLGQSEEITNKIENVELKETPASCQEVTENDLSTPHIDGSVNDAEHSSRESIPSPVAVGSESVHAFRAPVDDTQDLFSDSEINEIKEEALNAKLNKPSEEVFAPSMLAMNLKFDSAPLDDDISSDDEENVRENIVPHLPGSTDSTLPPNGDPVKAFVDEEAEEEDDSDNDLQRFQDNEEGEDDDDIEELNDMIATGYEEDPIDREKRDQLHQQWLEQQDTTGMDSLLQKLNCGSRLKESDDEQEDEESKETDNESDNESNDEAEDFTAPSDAVKINLKKMKQMIPQMFTDKDEPYVSSDEETEERLAKQCLSYRVVSSHFSAIIEEKAQFFSPAEDESSRGVFNLIKKLNVVPDTKRKGRTPSIFEMPHIGQKTNISSKSSFVGRASNQFVPSSKKHGTSKVRSSFIFGRDDSNSRLSLLISEDSSDTIVRESQAPKVASAKFQRSTQIKYTTSNSKSQESKVSLLEVLRRSSHQTERCVQNAAGVKQNESVFEAFKLRRKSIKTGDRV
ncbi:RNA polymerase-associated protein LEO1 isoform X1 [Trifolium pratense]|uniref:RNA polymerase-associated protein LEO1 isoform X1 n=1 Tax=Trifolium pratense TaxID=57577 RepID=UPI001E692763|nr:RNA polymerase-associated protein LEO1 isoform X1 [Trifolium pratense]